MHSSDRKLFVFVIICTIVLMIFGYSWKQRTEIPYISAPLSGLATPFAYGTSRTVNTIAESASYLKNKIFFDSEIKKLQNELVDEKINISNYKELVAQNIRLRQMLQFKTTHPEYRLLAAQIITRDFGYGIKTFVIDQGEEEGIRPMMGVVAPGGVVGFISDVYPHSARVQALIDPRTAIGVIVQRPESRLATIAKGKVSNPNEMEIVDVPKDGDILAGDTLVTSGYGGVYPKGISVGYVKDIKNDGEGYVNYANVKPSVNFYTLEEVFVITGSSVPVPVWSNKTLKLIPPTNRNKVEGVS